MTGESPLSTKQEKLISPKTDTICEKVMVLETKNRPCLTIEVLQAVLMPFVLSPTKISNEK